MQDHEFAHLFVRGCAMFGLVVASSFAFVVVTAQATSLESTFGGVQTMQSAAAENAVLSHNDMMRPAMPPMASSSATSTPPRMQPAPMGSSSPAHILSNVQAKVCPALTQDLQKGNYDAATGTSQIRDLQKFLANYYNVDPSQLVTGYFGSTTQHYLSQFQSSQGLPSQGFAGTFTRAAISRICGSSTPQTVPATNQVSSGALQGVAPATITLSATPMNGLAPLAVSFSAVSTQNLSGAEIAFGDRLSGQLTMSTCSGGACTYTAQHTYATAGTYNAAVTNGVKLFVVTISAAGSSQ